MANSRRSSCRTISHRAKEILWKSFCHFTYLILLLLTFSYHARLQNCTIRPIERIARHANDPDRLLAALAYFQAKKRKELDWVRPASTLSAIAVVGVLSWQGVNQAFWVAKVFWYWGLSFSFFSLISSAIDQLLEYLPSSEDDTFSEKESEAMLALFVCGKVEKSNSHAIDAATTYKPKWLMVYVWQCPAMLMSWSWVMFYSGFMLFILTPVIRDSDTEHERQTITAVMIVCGFAIMNFFLCSFAANRALGEIRRDLDCDIDRHKGRSKELKP